MATTEKTNNPLPSTVTQHPVGTGLQPKPGWSQPPPVLGAMGCQDQRGRKVFKLMPNTSQELQGQIPAAPAPPSHRVLWLGGDPPDMES